MIKWISTSDTSRKPEIGEPVFIRLAEPGVDVDFAIAAVWKILHTEKLGSPWSWVPYGYAIGRDDGWDLDSVTHWAEIPEGFFNEPTA